jgi:glycosyltransferase involved in cell wall biosynthesis
VFHVHVHNTYDLRVLPLLLARRAARAGAVIVTEHLPRTDAAEPGMQRDPTKPPSWRKPGAAQGKRLLKRAQAGLADAIATPSQSSARFLLQRYGLDPACVRVVNNGIACDGPPTPLPRTDVLHVVSVGALGWRKGIDVLLEALRLVRRPCRLTVVGDGPVRALLERQAAGLARASVSFVGWLDDPLEAMRAADVVCVPSRFESSSYVALEAMRAGRPVVASRVDGLDEIVLDGETGFLLPREDPVALARTLDRLAADRALAQRLGSAGFSRVVQRYGVDRMIDELIAVYQEAASSRRCGATRRA